ncbi:hypothetical protein FHS95_002104 [Sphingomonas naasensis]|nr:hypothetical protein [Sphingomonas naasensis]
MAEDFHGPDWIEHRQLLFDALDGLIDRIFRRQ